jgi:hypothetical protein
MTQTVFAVTIMFNETHCHQEDLDLNHFYGFQLSF